MSRGGEKAAAPSASNPAPECGPRLTPLPQLASWEFTWCIRTPGGGSSFHRIRGPGNHKQETSAQKGLQHPCCWKDPCSEAKAISGELGQGQGQQPAEVIPTLFQPHVLLIELEDPRPVLFHQESEMHFLGL